MKTSLLPLALLALGLPGAALAHPPEFLEGRSPGQVVMAGHRPAYLLPAGLPSHGSRPWTGSTPPPYGIANGTRSRIGVAVPGYGAPAVLPGHGPMPWAPPTLPPTGIADGYGAGYGTPMPGYSYRQPGITYDYGYGQPQPYGVAEMAPTTNRGCSPNATRVLLGAAIGGLSSAALAPNARARSWAIPVGAALGGLGGLATSC